MMSHQKTKQVLASIAGPCIGIPACQTGTAASYPGAKPDGLSSIELPGGEHVSFGSITWKYNLQRCATGDF